MKEGWIVKKLGEVCESDLGKTINKSKDKGRFYPYLCSINVLWNAFDFSTIKEAKFEETELDKYSVSKGDLLICEGGDIGRAAIWNFDNTILYQNALHRVRCYDNLNSMFCLYYLKYLKEKGILDSKYAKGVTIKHLVKSALLSIPIPIPPLFEQHRIVSELDCLNGIIDKKREQLKELDALAQSIFYDMFGDPIMNEKGWEVKRIKNIAQVKIGPFGSLLHAHDYVENGHPVINPVHLKEGKISVDYNFTINDEKYFEMISYQLIANDIIFGRRGDIGRCALVSEHEDKCICGTGCLYIRFREKINPQFSICSLNNKSITNYLMSRAKGATMLNINCNIIENMPMILPPLSLQQEFAEKISAIDKQKELIKQSLAEVENLFNSRMDYYFH